MATTVIDGDRLRLTSVQRLDHFSGSPNRAEALAGLVRAVKASRNALWAIDFPFGLPIELRFGDWSRQLELVRKWEGDANSFGHHCLATSKRLNNGVGHVRRLTDVETKTPFDCYHYRIIYQTFHGMRDVLAPLEHEPKTKILPYQEKVDDSDERIVVEACPSSTLKRLGLPHQKYKQPSGKPPDDVRRATKRIILKGICDFITIGDSPRRRMMDDSGGDALDAALAAVGGWHGYHTLGNGTSGSDRYMREGRIYA